MRSTGERPQPSASRHMTHGDHPKPLEARCDETRRVRTAVATPAALAAATRCSMPGAGSNQPGERDLADERGAGRRGDPRGGRGERGRHGEIARRIVDPDAPRDAPNSSARPSGTPALRSTTAATCWNRRRSSPVDLPASWPRRRRRPGPGPRPRALAAPASGRADRRAGVTLAATQQARGVDGPEPVAPISNHAVSPSAPKRFLPPRHDPEPRPRVALEAEHDVDRVLEGPRTGQIAVLRHVTRQQDRRCPPAFASPTSASVQARTCATPRAGCRLDVAEGLDESTASTSGRVGEPRQHLREVPPGRERDRLDRPRPGAWRGPRPGRGIPHPTPPGRRSPAAAIGDTTAAPGSTCRCRAPRRAARPSPPRGRRRAPGPGRGAPSRPEAVDGARLPERGESAGPRRRPPAGGRAPRDRAPSAAAGAPAGPLGGPLPAVRTRETDARLRHGRTLAGPADRPGWLIRATVSEGRVRVAVSPGEAVRLSLGLKGVNAAVSLARGPELPIPSG